MTSQSSRGEFVAFLQKYGKVLEGLCLEEGLAFMILFYTTVRATDSQSLDDDGDMLIAQWGTSSGPDGVSVLQFDITRQFGVEHGDHTDYFQLTLRFEAPTPPQQVFASGDSDWVSTPDDVEVLENAIYEDESARLVIASVDERQARVELIFDHM
jgi:hypothetical protein